MSEYNSLRTGAAEDGDLPRRLLQGQPGGADPAARGLQTTDPAQRSGDPDAPREIRPEAKGRRPGSDQRTLASAAPSCDPRQVPGIHGEAIDLGGC